MSNDSEERLIKKKLKIKRVIKILIILHIYLQIINYFDNWEGDNYFLFCHNTITGPLSIKALIATFSSLFIPVLIFVSFNGKVIYYIIFYF